MALGALQAGRVPAPTAPLPERSTAAGWRVASVQLRCTSRVVAAAAAGKGGAGARPEGRSSRAAKLFELQQEGAYESSTDPSTGSPAGGAGREAAAPGPSSLLDDGWGVAVSVPGPSSAAASAAAAAAAKKPQSKKRSKIMGSTAAAAAAGAAGAALAATAPAPAPAAPGGRAPPRSSGRVGTPYLDKSSEAGMLGLTLLQHRLIEEGRAEHDSDTKARVAAEAVARQERQVRRRKRDWVDPEQLDPGEGEAEEVQQYFQLDLGADGNTEVVEFDEDGRILLRRAPGTGTRSAAAGAAEDDDDDPLAFLSDERPAGSRGAGGGASSSGRGAAGGAAAPARGRSAGAGQRRAWDDEDDDDDELYADDGLPGSNPLADEQLEWGLDELPGGMEGGRRPSLLQDLGVIKSKKDRLAERAAEKKATKGQAKGKAGAAGAGKGGPQAAGGPGGAPDAGMDEGEGLDEQDAELRSLSVVWGGTGGASGVDMEAQEALLRRLYKPNKVKQLMAHQLAAEEELASMKRRISGKHVLEAKTHSRMRIIAGSCAGRQLASSKGATTRPMMEKVRQAIFNMMQAQAGSAGGLPPGCRWLDLFAGTGSVGLEALSRGAGECHFIELDSWVCKKVLSKNIATCGFQRSSVVHTMKAEDFLRRSIAAPRFAGGAFDFVSVCPPYLVVSYPELMGLLDASPLLHAGSVVFVEYPKQLEHQVPAVLGPLVTVRDRKYGRTWIRVYASGSRGGAGGDEEGGEEEGEEGDELLL